MPTAAPARAGLQIGPDEQRRSGLPDDFPRRVQGWTVEPRRPCLLPDGHGVCRLPHRRVLAFRSDPTNNDDQGFRMIFRGVFRAGLSSHAVLVYCLMVTVYADCRTGACWPSDRTRRTTTIRASG